MCIKAYLLGEKLIVIYDSLCNLCVNSVMFIIQNDKNRKFKFVNAQSTLGKKLLNQYGENISSLDSIILIENNKAHIKSNAVLHIAKELDGFWKLSYILKIVPRFLRDKCYDYVAKNRDKFFKTNSICKIYANDLENRFLE